MKINTNKEVKSITIDFSIEEIQWLAALLGSSKCPNNHFFAKLYNAIVDEGIVFQSFVDKYSKIEKFKVS